jgi:hypothetical protein
VACVREMHGALDLSDQLAQSTPQQHTVVMAARAVCHVARVTRAARCGRACARCHATPRRQLRTTARSRVGGAHASE